LLVNEKFARTVGVKEKVLEGGMMKLKWGICGVFYIGYPDDRMKATHRLVKGTLVEAEKVAEYLSGAKPIKIPK
jgi:hypothetical protein